MISQYLKSLSILKNVIVSENIDIDCFNLPSFNLYKYYIIIAIMLLSSSFSIFVPTFAEYQSSLSEINSTDVDSFRINNIEKQDSFRINNIENQDSFRINNIENQILFNKAEALYESTKI